MICNRFDVVTVPFPFVERPGTKKRPAAVLSNRQFNRGRHTILAMITTQAEPAWPGDSPIVDFTAAGLRLPCLVRFKFFTLDNRLLRRKIGHLSLPDQQRLEIQLQSYLLESIA